MESPEDDSPLTTKGLRDELQKFQERSEVAQEMLHKRLLQELRGQVKTDLHEELDVLCESLSAMTKHFSRSTCYTMSAILRPDLDLEEPIGPFAGPYDCESPDIRAVTFQEEADDPEIWHPQKVPAPPQSPNALTPAPLDGGMIVKQSGQTLFFKSGQMNNMVSPVANDWNHKPATAPRGLPPPLPPIPNKLPDSEQDSDDGMRSESKERLRLSAVSPARQPARASIVSYASEIHDDEDLGGWRHSQGSLLRSQDSDEYGGYGMQSCLVGSNGSTGTDAVRGRTSQHSAYMSSVQTSPDGWAQGDEEEGAEEENFREKGSVPSMFGKDDSLEPVAERESHVSTGSNVSGAQLREQKSDTMGGRSWATRASNAAGHVVFTGVNQEDWMLSPVRRKMKKYVLNPWFEYVVGFLLMMNATTIGVSAQYRAIAPSRAIKPIFIQLELAFGLAFTCELILRLYVFRLSFFVMKGKAWNIFDFVVVSLQDLEIGLDLLMQGDDNALADMSFVRLLRLGRVMRLLRMVRLIPELKSMVYLIAASMQSFIWTMVLMCFLMYGVAVHLTEVVADHRKVTEGQDHSAFIDAWGTLPASIDSLYQSILGGIDWKELMDDLKLISWSVPVVFNMYIAFAALVMLNLVTGVFVEGAQRIVAEDRDAELVRQAKKVFSIVDDSEDNEISWDEFVSHLEDTSMAEYFKMLGISRNDAKDLFKLLDLDRSGNISLKEFVNGCLQLRGPAKSLDLARLAYNADIQGRRIREMQGILSELNAPQAELEGQLSQGGRPLEGQVCRTSMTRGFSTAAPGTRDHRQSINMSKMFTGADSTDRDSEVMNSAASFKPSASRSRCTIGSEMGHKHPVSVRCSAN